MRFIFNKIFFYILGVKPFTCEICGKGFHQKGNYKNHKLTHSKEKQHKCPICDKSFHQAYNLTFHMYTHRQEKPYRCELCDKGFCRNFDLKKHMRKIHNQTPEKISSISDSVTQQDTPEIRAPPHNEPTKSLPQMKTPALSASEYCTMPFLQNISHVSSQLSFSLPHDLQLFEQNPCSFRMGLQIPPPDVLRRIMPYSSSGSMPSI